MGFYEPFNIMTHGYSWEFSFRLKPFTQFQPFTIHPSSGVSRPRLASTSPTAPVPRLPLPVARRCGTLETIGYPAPGRWTIGNPGALGWTPWTRWRPSKRSRSPDGIYGIYGILPKHIQPYPTHHFCKSWCPRSRSRSVGLYITPITPDGLWYA